MLTALHRWLISPYVVAAPSAQMLGVAVSLQVQPHTADLELDWWGFYKSCIQVEEQNSPM